ncbi:MarR family transcriptional regulator [Niallia oryzisoli]|uniref:MarR family transcriptional regulator n=1 Tax=Niallia oryzisoli TaxID=1737571 RepID=A0ABZ2CB96_9BACI
MSSNEKIKADLLDDINQQLRKFSTRNVLFQQNIAQSMGLVHTDLKTADILNETGPLTAGEISQITGLSTGSVTALLDRLEHAGFIKREKDPNDRRKVIIVPIKEQQDLIKARYSSISKTTKEYCQRYDEKELKLILQFTTDITHIIEEEINKVRT